MKTYLINEDEIKSFSDKQKMREFVNNILKPEKNERELDRKKMISWKYKMKTGMKNNGNYKYVNKYQL